MHLDPDAIVEALKRDPDRLARYDLNGNGVIDPAEWKLVAQLAENEITYRSQRISQEVYVLLDNVFLKNYEVLGVLGKGGQATTYLCRDEAEKRYLVLKERCLRDVTDWKVVDLFDREADTLSKLDHPQIPTYFDHFTIENETDVRLYVGQEFKSGDNLEEVLRKRGTFDAARIEEFCAEILPVLGYLHDRAVPIVHRDVKPSNIIFAEDGYHLIDFGSVQVSNKELGGSTVTGTFGYAPLEQFMGRAEPASDIYSLGATILELLAGQPPFEWVIENGQIDLDQFSLSEAIRSNLEAMLQTFPNARPSWSEVLQFRWGSTEIVSLMKSHTFEMSIDVFEDIDVFDENAIDVRTLNLVDCQERIKVDSIRYDDVTSKLAKSTSVDLGVVVAAIVGIVVILSAGPGPLAWVAGAVLIVLGFIGAMIKPGSIPFLPSPKANPKRLLESRETVFSLNQSIVEFDEVKAEWKSIKAIGDSIELETDIGIYQLCVGEAFATRINSVASQLKSEGRVIYFTERAGVVKVLASD